MDLLTFEKIAGMGNTNMDHCKGNVMNHHHFSGCLYPCSVHVC